MQKSILEKFNTKAKSVVAAAVLTASAFFGSVLHAKSNAAAKPDRETGTPRVTESFNNTITVGFSPVATWHWEFLKDGKLIPPHRESGLNERHTFGSLRVDTEDYGNWGLFTLLPNSQGKHTFGFAYIHNFYTWNFYKGAKVDFSGALGVATGYNESVVPFAALELTLKVPMTERTTLNVDMGMAPYSQGVVFRSPVIGASYKF